MVQLLLILNEILSEVGDFDKIEAYKHSNNQFITDEGWGVDVNFKVFDQKEINYMNLGSYNVGELYDISYTVNNNENQFEKSNYLSLVKIIKTVTEILFNFIRSNKQVKAIIILGANRNKDKHFTETDPKKTSFYKAIIMKNISKVGWNWKNIKLEGLEGLMLYK